MKKRVFYKPTLLEKIQRKPSWLKAGIASSLFGLILILCSFFNNFLAQPAFLGGITLPVCKFALAPFFPEHANLLQPDSYYLSVFFLFSLLTLLCWFLIGALIGFLIDIFFLRHH